MLLETQIDRPEGSESAATSPESAETGPEPEISADENGASGDSSRPDVAAADGIPDAATRSPAGIALGQVSDQKIAANRANAEKSTGPRTPEGKERSRINAFKYCSIRLLGAAEFKTVRMIPGEAEKLYQQLMTPYEPVPPMLALHFQDLARLHLELEAWERIRDAYLEHRGQQNELEMARRLQEIARDLPRISRETQGLYRVEDSVAKFEAIINSLMLLDSQLHKRKINGDTDNVVKSLYGWDLNSDHDRGQEICYRWQALLSRKSRPTRKAIQHLRDLVAIELQDARFAHTLRRNEKDMTPCACMAGLEANTIEEQRMFRHGQALRQAVDRKQGVINRLLRVLGLAAPESGERGCGGKEKN